MDNGKLISCFPTFKDIRNLSFMSILRLMPQNNTPIFRDLVLGTKKNRQIILNRDSRITPFSVQLFAAARIK